MRSPAPAEVPLLDAAAARAGDEHAVESGETWAGLMERAAGHLARGVVAAAGGRGYGRKVAVVVGKGNNGGDGWAVARRLHALGAACWVVSVPPLDAELSAEADENRRRWREAGGRTSAGLGDLDAALAWADVAVDALLGTGITGAPRGDVGTACAALLAARGRGDLAVVACDVPSGVSSDDGAAPEGAVRADLTVTFGGWKRGLLLHPGSEHAGRVVVGPLGPRYRPPQIAWSALTAVGAAPAPLTADTDKRARGVVKVVAGSVGSGGAALLCARGALAAGAGLLTLATPAHVQRVLVPLIAPAMTEPLAHAGEALSPKGAAQVDLDGLDAVVAGPGLTPGEGTYALARRLLDEAPRSVLDADALNVFRDDPARLAEHAGELVLTPHQRELARIGGGDDGDDAWTNRVERVPELAARYGATIVAKGPGTIVAAPDGRVWVTPTGSPALGSGGTGDVLAGVIAAAVARADDVPLAVARAVWWHGHAGELAGRGNAGYANADDLVAALPRALDEVRARADAGDPYPFTGPPWPAIRAGDAQMLASAAPIAPREAGRR